MASTKNPTTRERGLERDIPSDMQPFETSRWLDPENLIHTMRECFQRQCAYPNDNTALNETNHEHTPVKTSIPSLETEEKFIRLFDPNASIKYRLTDVILLEATSKALLLYDYKFDFCTIVVSINKEKIPKETTALYMKAREIMQQITDARKTPTTYRIKTNNVNMIKWALTTGQQIFNWEHQKLPSKALNFWEFHTTITPCPTNR